VRSAIACSATSTGRKKDYTRIPIEEQVEVLALVGDIALNDGEPKLHTHVVVSKAAICSRRTCARRSR
jgi:predicted DNA-binding protein with PD1-like motif